VCLAYWSGILSAFTLVNCRWRTQPDRHEAVADSAGSISSNYRQ
jgi:hypothetical protein